MVAALATGVIGADVDRVDSGVSASSLVGSQFPLGTELVGADGNTYRYVQAGAAISTTLNEPYALAIDNLHQATLLTAANGLLGYRFGVAPRQIIAQFAFFWARIRGSFPLRVSASAAANAVLGIGGVGASGRLASSVTASAGNMTVFGLVITAVASASVSAGNTIRTCIATFPVCTTAVAD